ncbi:MAG: WXG100 family type VII secretion target [Candidatus Brocadiales bacterium]|nr:WXG100 family type VII secretion target [Candidatus Brocadiales bacterium]
MDGKIDIDVDELERFANQLKDFNQQLEHITYKIEGQLQNLGSTWRDNQYAKFSEEWYSTFRTIHKYIDQNAPEYVRSLKVKVAKLRDARR